MRYNSEREMYPEVALWLTRYLKHKYPKASVKAYDTSRENLSDFLRRRRLSRYFPESETYVIKVDVTGVIKHKEKCFLAFVECKLNAVSLKDISQLIGYSKVVLPVFSIIVSPVGISSPVNKLINVYRRYDILSYTDKQKVRVASWDKMSCDIETATLLPHGEHLL